MQVWLKALQLHIGAHVSKAALLTRPSCCLLLCLFVLLPDHGLFVLFNCYFPACSGNNGLEQIEVRACMPRCQHSLVSVITSTAHHPAPL